MEFNRLTSSWVSGEMISDRSVLSAREIGISAVQLITRKAEKTRAITLDDKCLILIQLGQYINQGSISPLLKISAYGPSRCFENYFSYIFENLLIKNLPTKLLAAITKTAMAICSNIALYILTFLSFAIV